MTTPPPARPFPDFFRPALAALGAALLVLGGHFWMIERASSPWPVHDQWLAEGEMLYVPIVENRLAWPLLFHAHAEHRIAPTRLLALTLFQLNDRQWDVRLQMTVNSFLAAALAGMLVLVAAPQLGKWTLVWFATGFGALLASPLFYGNALWGFQSQFYFLILFSVAHLTLVLRCPVRSAPWFVGLICSLLAIVSMGSGFFSAAIVALLATWTLWRSADVVERRTAMTNLTLHLILSGAAIAWAPARSAVSYDLGATVHTFLHCLSWPHRFYTPWGAWVWIPFLLFSGAFLRRRTASAPEKLVMALGAWVLAQIIAISVARSAPAIVITPRYYELFWTGLTTNVLALPFLWRLFTEAGVSRLVRAVVALLFVAWLAPVSFKAWSFAESHWRHDLPAMATFAAHQTTHVTAFLATDQLRELQAAPYPNVPHPDAGYLAGQLRNPLVRNALASVLDPATAPALSRWAASLRSVPPLGWFAGGELLLIAAGLFRRRSAIQ